MKAKILKIVLPSFVILVAVFSAFAFKSTENKKLLTPETGWINLPGDPCAIKVQCDTTPTPFVCTAIYNGITYQALGKTNPQMMICNKVLYRPF